MRLCLVGKKLGHSYSELIHRQLCGLDYSLVEVMPEELGEFARSGGYDGFNVTVPYKRDILPYLDMLSEGAQRIGAVNTVLRRDGKLYGYNTDIDGVEYAFARMGVSVAGKNVMIFGTGGAMRACRAACEDMGAARIDVVGRTSPLNYQNCYDIRDTQIAINATPVGMAPNAGASPAELGRFKALEGAFDCVYNPQVTEFVRTARFFGVPSENGLSMLVCQAVRAQRIWGAPCDRSIEELIAEVKQRTVNIVLVGMPAAGKTTLGRIVARQLGKRLIDTDELVQKNTGRTAEQIICESGEAAFRDEEARAVAAAASEAGVVIACGGGAVLREDNVRALRSNGIVYLVSRPLDRLVTDGRPLSGQKGVFRLYEERRQAYERAATAVINNDGSPEAAAKEMIEHYEAACYQRTQP